MHFTITKDKLSDFFVGPGIKFSYEHFYRCFPPEVTRHLTAARKYELEPKGTVPACETLGGFVFKRIWYLDVARTPYNVYGLILDHGRPSGTATFEELHDLLDGLREKLNDAPRARSAFMREIVRSVPHLDGEQHQELDGYARACGM